MKVKINKISFGLTLLVIAFTLPNTKAQKTQTDKNENKYPIVSVCDLHKPSTKYQKKIVKVKGTYFRSFEHTSLVDKSCVIGIEFSSLAQSNDFDERNRKLIKGNFYDGTFVGVTLIGEIEVVDTTEVSTNHPKVIIHVFEVVKSFKVKEPK